MKKMIKGFIKAIIIICVLLFVLFVILFVMAGIKVIKGPIDATDTRRSISISIVSLSGKKEELDLQYYETLEEALQNDELIQDENTGLGEVDYKMKDAVELLQVQKDDNLAVFYTRARKDGGVTRVTYVLIKMKDGKFSQPYRMGMVGRRPGYYTAEGKSRYSYDCDDGIAFYIEQEAAITFIFGNQEGQIPVFFGMWDDKDEIESLTVAGESPQIIPVEAKEETRYFWYFEDAHWFDKLEEIDWSDYTYGEIINLLEIKYDKADN